MCFEICPFEIGKNFFEGRSAHGVGSNETNISLEYICIGDGIVLISLQATTIEMFHFERVE